MTEALKNLIENNFYVAKNQGGVPISAEREKRCDTNYTDKDTFTVNPFSGYIYINGSRGSYERLKQFKDSGYDPEYAMPEGYPGYSGFFTDEATASSCFLENGQYDTVKLSQLLQQAPRLNSWKERLRKRKAYHMYCTHMACFRIDMDKFKELYGSDVFYAATGKCLANYQWGQGGGFQGFLPNINKLINEGVLVFEEEKSREARMAICEDYKERKAVARKIATKINDYIESHKITGTSGERLSFSEIRQNNLASIKQIPNTAKVELAILIGLLLGFAISALTCAGGGLVQNLLWIVASLAPFALLLIATWRNKGLPKLFQNRIFAIAYLITIVLLWIFMSWILMVLMFAYIILGVLVLLKGVSIFAPDGMIQISTTDENGQTTHETRAVYGDMDSAISNVKDELSQKGYTDIREN